MAGITVICRLKQTGMIYITLMCADVPTATVLSDTVYAWRGQTRQLTCVAQAMPPPTISWLRGGAAGFFVAENDIYKISNSREGDTTTSVLTVRLRTDVFVNLSNVVIFCW